ncbi:F-box/kelch-repeat protein At3g06240-like [Neltuma alba]|uniref:F-box/kelch-repeat protein At3g06240-like n=1 Tax=Neltuma alba TaxID=207710 RepID=UPI0010A2FD41|nr:F-box/kelch-repeat protein At3g06240-like [Prosopis alba]
MKKEVDGDAPVLPEKIIRNILKRLPVKSLVRFQCVCRHWRNLFKTASFIADHLHHSNHQNPYLLFQRDGWDDPSNLYWLDSEMQVRDFQNPLLLDYLKRGKIVGSSNGLLCVEINKHDVSPHFLLVWNPAIREVRLVPETNFHEDYYLYSVAFGFSPIINDYKIVILYVNEYYTELSAVKVYSLSSGSWKEVKFRLNHSTCLHSHCVTVNGVMFWLGSKRVGEDPDDNEGLIVSLDLATEAFRVIPIPEHDFFSTLAVYEEKLAMVSGIRSTGHSVIHLWVMEQGVVASGERWNWTKKYTSSPYPCKLYPRTIWRNVIVCTDDMEDESTAVLFNLTTKRIKKLAISKCDDGHDIFNYAESLVPVGGMKSFANFL